VGGGGVDRWLMISERYKSSSFFFKRLHRVGVHSSSHLVHSIDVLRRCILTGQLLSPVLLSCISDILKISYSDSADFSLGLLTPGRFLVR
jgi:hypothetical protein